MASPVLLFIFLPVVVTFHNLSRGTSKKINIQLSKSKGRIRDGSVFFNTKLAS
jgi:hypothetical protein